MFDNIITMGFSCAIAQSCRKYGLRNKSYPFDWGVSRLDGILNAVEEDFADFLNEKWIAKAEDGMYYHNKYKYYFVHDFNNWIWSDIDFKEQFSYVSEKYQKKISNFINDYRMGNALIIRQIKDMNEAEYIVSNMDRIRNVLLEAGSINNKNSILWLGENKVVEYLRQKNLAVYEVPIDWEDGRSGLLLDHNIELKTRLLSGQIDSKKQVKNLLYASSLYEQSMRKGMISERIKDKILKILFDPVKESILKDRLVKKNFIIYGAGGQGWALGGLLKSLKLYPIYYLDQSRKKEGMMIWDREIISLNQAKSYKYPDLIILALPYKEKELDFVKTLLGRCFSCELVDIECLLDQIIGNQ